jgi:AcrR family transcriptional regulator
MTSSGDAREQLIVAAERLIAERGIDVALRDVARAAGQRNNSAVHYHFGSRDGLIEAVVRFRIGALEARRLELLAEHEDAGAPDDPATLVRLIVAPMLDVPYQQGATHYARFLEVVRNHPALTGRPLDDQPTIRIILSRLGRCLDLSPALRRRRFSAMATVLFALLADVERADGVRRTDRHGDELVAMLVGLLTAAPLRR